MARNLTAVGCALAIATAAAGCGGKPVDTSAARSFGGYPLYWVGPHFERWDLTYVSVGQGEFSTFVYGTCEVQGDDGGCPPPFQIQIQPLCAHLEVVARDRVWQVRSVRGAPLGRIDAAPVLFTGRVQIKVYRGQGSDPGLPLRVLRALRSANRVPPLLAPGEPIPRPSAETLRKGC